MAMLQVLQYHFQEKPKYYQDCMKSLSTEHVLFRLHQFGLCLRIHI
jgi:hypothetical protein